MNNSPDNERGAVVVMVAMMLPVLALLLAFAVDVSHWWVHQRHLQTQVDAGVFAGAIGPWFPGTACNDNPMNTESIVGKAREYSGDFGPAALDLDPYNPQYSNKENVTVLVNASDYLHNGGEDYDGQPTVNNPCSTMFLDLKATEEDLSNFFGSLPGVSFIPTAHARISLFQLSSASGALPIGVPDPDPDYGIVTYVTLNGGELPSGSCSPSCTVQLTKTGYDSTLNLNNWEHAPVWVTVTEPGIGVRIAFADTTLDAGTDSAAVGSATCARFLVECYELTDTGESPYVPLHIRGYSDTPSSTATTPPEARDVRLLPVGGCADAYFSSRDVGCTDVQLGAHVDIGGRAPGNVKLRAHGGSCPNNGCVLSYQSDDYWTTSIGIVDDPPLNTFTLDWEVTTGTITGLGVCRNGNNNPCQGGFGPVQWHYAALAAGDSPTGPMMKAEIWEGGAKGANSFDEASYNLVVKIGLEGNLANAGSASDPAVVLRVAKDRTETDPSQTQALDCDPDTPTLRGELAAGCTPWFKINQNPTVDCSDLQWGGQGLTGVAQPWPCVGVQTGAAVNQVAEGMADRILQGGTCDEHPNNWDSSFFDTGPPVGDTRVTEVFVTSFGSFSGVGAGPGSSTPVSINYFATFYVTGWASNDSNGKVTYCPGDESLPSCRRNCKGRIIGHFIKYAPVLPGGTGTDPCDPDAFGSCVPILTD